MGQAKEEVAVIIEDPLETSRALGPPSPSLRLQHLSAATGLILTYLIEVVVQVVDDSYT